MFSIHSRDTRTLASSGWKRGLAVSYAAPSPEPQPGPGPGSHLPTEALARIRNGLRGHERWGPGRAGQLSIVSLKLVADAEVGNLHVPVVPQEQVGWLDVPVDDLLAVHYRERQLEHGPAGPLPRTAHLPSPGQGSPSQVRRSPHHTHSSYKDLSRGLRGPALHPAVKTLRPAQAMSRDTGLGS